jgi:hypothetical protein
MSGHLTHCTPEKYQYIFKGGRMSPRANVNASEWRKSLSPVGNWTLICQSPSLSPSHYTTRGVAALHVFTVIFLIVVVSGMCEWCIASAYDMPIMSAVTWSTLQCIVSIFVCHKDAQNIIHGIVVLNFEKKIKIPWCWVLGAGLLCYVI